jgi:hypothetical protein
VKPPIQDPSPVLERLQRKHHIVPLHGHPDYFAITDAGKQKAGQQRWWEFWR